VGNFILDGAAVAAIIPPPTVVRVLEVGADAGGFIRSPYLGCVTHLSVYYRARPESLHQPTGPLVGEWESAARRLTRLTGIDLEGCAITDDLLAVAVHLPLPRLADVDVSNNLVTEAGVVELLSSPWPHQLKRLVLGANPLSDQAAFDLADRWPRGSPLENLNLRFCQFSPSGQQALLARFGGKVDLF
jgi:hypothetical protein